VAGDQAIVDLVHALGGKALVIPAQARAAYHAAACMASNHLVALLGQVQRVAATVGLPLEAFLPLARGASTTSAGSDLPRRSQARSLAGPDHDRTSPPGVGPGRAWRLRRWGRPRPPTCDRGPARMSVPDRTPAASCGRGAGHHRPGNLGRECGGNHLTRRVPKGDLGRARRWLPPRPCADDGRLP